MLKSKFLKHTLVFSIIFSLSITNPSLATASADGAKKFIETVSSETIKVLKTKNIDDEGKEKRLTQIFKKSIDTKWIAKFVLGKHWRQTSEEQREKYIKYHEHFLISSYIPKFKEFNNQQIDINKVIKNEEKEYTVITKIIQPQGPSISVDYKIREYGKDEYKIYDVVAEGVSLANTQRSDFGAFIARKSVNDLIKILEKKAS